MRRIHSLLIVVIFISSCGRKADTAFSKVLNSSNLPVQAFTIDTQRDTLVSTKSGVRISIPASAISSSSLQVTLQVQEALTMEAIVTAGLFTESKAGMLSSAGMVNINTKEESTFNKPITISVPARFTNGSMKLYKGEEEKGKIVWEDPQPIETKQADINYSGEALFKKNCASCHGIEKDLTGPALAHIEKKHSREWLYAYTRNNRELLQSGDGYACCIYNKYNKAAMNIFPSLDDTSLSAIYNYIAKITDSLAIPYDPTIKSDCDSCDEVTQHVAELIRRRNELTGDNGKMVQRIDSMPRNEQGGIIPKIEPLNYAAEYYQFSISAYGWYNIDALLNEKPGVEMSELKVKLNVQAGVKMHVSLIIPATKTFAEGGYLNGNETYGFYESDGQVPLPQKAVAYIVAMGESNGKMYFAKRQFITSLQQTVVINVQESNKEEIKKAIESMQLKDVAIEIEETKNFNSIKKIDEELKKLRLKCNCLSNSVVYDYLGAEGYSLGVNDSNDYIVPEGKEN